MTMDEGTPKRRRGLFRRGRAEATPAPDARPSADGFDDPWSASAWDDWDDDFTNGGTRSSVPPAAAPRPEAVDAWLQSEADDFDTATRRNTKRWGGDANRPTDPGTGLSSLRAEIEPPAPTHTTAPSGSGLAELRATDAVATHDNLADDRDDSNDADLGADGDPADGDTDLSHHVPSDWATDPDLVGLEDDAGGDQDMEFDRALDEIDRERTSEAVHPTWEPLTALETETADLVPDPTAEVNRQVADHDIDDPAADAEALLDEQPDPSTDDAPLIEADAPLIEAEVSDTPLIEADVDDDVILDDHGVADHLDLDDLAALDQPPSEVAPPIASWAPMATEEAPMASEEAFVASEEIRVRLPGIEPTAPTQPTPAQPTPTPPTPTPPTPPTSRFVTVSVVSDDRTPETATPATSFATEFDAEPPSRQVQTATDAAPGSPLADEDVPTGDPEFEIPELAASSSSSPSVPTAPGRRWAALAAEFSSDGDLDDSFPSRPRPTGSASPALQRPAEPSAQLLGTTSPMPDDVDPWALPPVRQAVRSDVDARLSPTPHRDAVLSVEEPEPDARPVPLGTQPAGATAGPSDSPTPDDEDPWKRPPERTGRPETGDRGTPSHPPENTPAATPRTARNPALPPARVAPERLAVVNRPGGFAEPLARPIDAAPELSTFAGILGTMLVSFAVVRIVFTLLGDQPSISTRFTGTEARLLRVGESFGSSGSAWPLALAIGAILLVLPAYLPIRSHLRRWATMIGLAAVAGIVSILIGFLRFAAGQRLDSASTLKLLSDVIVGPIGFGAVTLVAISVAVRARA